MTEVKAQPGINPAAAPSRATPPRARTTSAAAATSAGVYWQKRLEQDVEESRREPSTPFEMAEVNELNANPATGRATVLQKVVDGITVIAEGNQQFNTSYGQAFYNAELNRAFVLLEYFGYMRRDPDEGGYAHWLGKWNFFGGDFVAAEMVLAFITSPEYRSGFGQP